MNSRKHTTRGELTEQINKVKPNLKRNLFMVTCFRATKDNQLQVEVCQNRSLGNSKSTMMSLLNKTDPRFRGDTTLLFDWMPLKPEDFVRLFPETDATVEELQEIADSWDPNAPTGKDAIVYPQLDTITRTYDEANDEDLTPILSVTEKTESELKDFFKGPDAEEKIEDIIERGNRRMKTGSGDDAEDLVHPETGEPIYRFVRTEFKERGAEDTIIAGKMPLSQFKKKMAKASKGSDVSEQTSNVRDLLGQNSKVE